MSVPTIIKCVSVVVAVVGCILTFSSKTALDKFSKSADLIDRYGDILGGAMSYRSPSGKKISTLPAYHYRIVGAVLTILGVIAFLTF